MRLHELGLGKHAIDVPLPNQSECLKQLYAGNIVYDCGMALVRASALLFYRRIFQFQRLEYRCMMWAGQGLNALWFVSITFLAIFSCTPIEYYWTRTGEGRCVGVFQVILASAVTSVAIDLYILLLPLPALWALQMKAVRKILVFGVFIGGYW